MEFVCELNYAKKMLSDSMSRGLPGYLPGFINTELYYFDTDAMEFEKLAAMDFCTTAL